MGKHGSNHCALRVYLGLVFLHCLSLWLHLLAIITKPLHSSLSLLPSLPIVPRVLIMTPYKVYPFADLRRKVRFVKEDIRSGLLTGTRLPGIRVEQLEAVDVGMVFI